MAEDQLTISSLKRFNSKRGLSLVELAVSMGIMSVLTLAIAQFADDVTASTSGSDFRANRLILRESIRDTLLSSAACACSFRAVVLPNPVNINTRTNAADIQSLVLHGIPSNCNSSVAEEYISTQRVISGLKATQIYLDRFTQYGPSKAVAHLNYDIETGKHILGPNILTDDILVVLNLSGDGSKIEGCGRAAASDIDTVPTDGPSFQIPVGPRAQYTIGALNIPAPNQIGRTMALIQVDVRSRNNFRLQFFEDSDPTLITGDYWISTGVDGHIEGKTFLALIPVQDGRFFATLSSSNGGTATIQLMARLPRPPAQAYFGNVVSIIRETDAPLVANVEVRLSEPATEVITVNYNLSSAQPTPTATEGVDFAALPPAILTFNPGVMVQNISVNIVGDNLNEVNENLKLEIVNVVGGDFTLGTATSHVLTIQDDD